MSPTIQPLLLYRLGNRLETERGRKPPEDRKVKSPRSRSWPVSSSLLVCPTTLTRRQTFPAAGDSTTPSISRGAQLDSPGAFYRIGSPRHYPAVPGPQMSLHDPDSTYDVAEPSSPAAEPPRPRASGPGRKGRHDG
jgi:hypothetical protein